MIAPCKAPSPRPEGGAFRRRRSLGGKHISASDRDGVESCPTDSGRPSRESGRSAVYCTSTAMRFPFRPFDCRLRRPESRHCSRRSQAQADYFGVYVRIPPGPPLWYKTGNADSRRLPSFGGCRRPQQGVFAALDVDRVVRDLDVLGEGADMFPPIAALSKPEANASFACQFRHGRFGVNLNSNSKAPDGLHRALLSQVTSRLLDGEDVEILDVCHHTVVPSA